MSERITLPAARIPLVDGQGRITREWLVLLNGLFKRAGGTEGFSNQELFGDVSGLQSYDELLERIATLEAQNRSLMQGVQMLAMAQLDQGYATPPQAVSPDTFARIKVLGETDLAVERGRVRVGLGINGSSAKLQVGGSVDVSGGTRLRGGLQVDGDANLQGNVNTGPLAVSGDAAANSYLVGGVQVVAGRQAGVPAYTAYAGQTIGAAYSQTQAQATDTAIKDASATLARVVTALRTHGLIGD